MTSRPKVQLAGAILVASSARETKENLWKSSQCDHDFQANSFEDNRGTRVRRGGRGSLLAL